MSAPSRKVVLAFMAHPDDAEILCAGTLIRLAGLGWEIHIATAASGDCGTMTETRWAIAGRRTGEATRSAAMIGARYHCLGESDAMIVYDKPTVQKALDLFRRVSPGLVFTHAIHDYMIDHEMASLLARAASFGHGAPNASEFPLLEGAAVPYLYYCDPIEGVDPLGRPVEPTTLVDITDQMPKKCEMLASHASQRDWLVQYHGMDEYIESMKRHAAHRGHLAGTTAAEAFVQHRGHAYPRSDLLAELFGTTNE